MARRWQPRQLHHRQVAFVVWNKLYLRTGVLSAGGGMR